jgi:ribosome-associated protein
MATDGVQGDSLPITSRITIPMSEIEMEAVRSQGAGGQNVNKSATAIHLRFDIRASSLPDVYKERLLALHDHRITKDSVVVIKAQQSRSQERNREEALSRLQQLIKSVVTTRKRRKATKPSRSARQKRLDRKKKHGRDKVLRKNVDPSGE